MRTLNIIPAFGVMTLLASPAAAQNTPQTNICPAGAPAVPAAQKQIKDAAEYKAYIAALNLADPTQKGAAMEAFVQSYPGSIVGLDALEQAMAAYQQAGGTTKVEALARRILQADQGHVRAAAIVVLFERTHATANGDMSLAEDASARADRGLKSLATWARPEEVDQATYGNICNQMDAIFEGAIAFGALQLKRYAIAASHYRKALLLEPENLTDAFQLSVADLQSDPLDPAGFWWAARASNLASAAHNAEAQKSVEAYAKAKYAKYHGGADGWDEIVAQAAKASGPPPGFAVKRAPTPDELAVQAVAENDVASLSFSDSLFILDRRDASAANRAAADKVWDHLMAMQGKTAVLKLPVKVIAASVNSFDVAITDDARRDGIVEMHVVLGVPTTQPVAVGTELNVTGRLTGYTTKPIRLAMEKGAVAP